MLLLNDNYLNGYTLTSIITLPELPKPPLECLVDQDTSSNVNTVSSISGHFSRNGKNYLIGTGIAAGVTALALIINYTIQEENLLPLLFFGGAAYGILTASKKGTNYD